MAVCAPLLPLVWPGHDGVRAFTPFGFGPAMTLCVPPPATCPCWCPRLLFPCLYRVCGMFSFLPLFSLTPRASSFPTMVAGAAPREWPEVELMSCRNWAMRNGATTVLPVGGTPLPLLSQTASSSPCLGPSTSFLTAWQESPLSQLASTPPPLCHLNRQSSPLTLPPLPPEQAVLHPSSLPPEDACPRRHKRHAYSIRTTTRVYDHTPIYRV